MILTIGERNIQATARMLPQTLQFSRFSMGWHPQPKIAMGPHNIIHREEGFIFRLRMCVRMESRSDFWSKRPTDLILGMPLEALWEPWRQINCTCNQNPLVFKMITHDEKYFSSLILRYSLTIQGSDATRKRIQRLNPGTDNGRYRHPA